MNGGHSDIWKRGLTGLSTLVFVLGLAACSGMTPDPVVEEEPRESIFGEGGILGLMDDDKKSSGASEGGVLGVNSYLWRAALDTINFMPMASADPFGGVIITDWHSPQGTANERFKMNIYILGRALRADGVRVAVFRQALTGSGWRDVATSPGANVRVEDAILMRARQLRNQKLIGE